VGVFRLPLFTRIFLAAWSLLILVLFLPTEVTGILSDGLTSQHLETITILALMLAFGVTFSWLGWFLGRSDMKKITELLQDAARRVNGREDR
jgi:undecaprenyl pyrophosphate phosphatase UppP